jgi:nicotinamide phosphoribosyltransferase
MENSALSTDGYKIDHRRQYPEKTTFVYSNLTCRSSKLANLPQEAHNDKTVFYGLSQFIQRFILEFWNKGFFDRPFDEIGQDYLSHINSYLGENEVGVEHLRRLHEYGRMPVKIKALPEGTLVPIQVPCLTIENTQDDFFWVTNYLETMLSCEMWKPITSATTAYAYRRLIDEFCELTGGTKDFVPFQGHDFSFRGMSGYYDACVSGSAHLTSFCGTDTIPAIPFLEKYYNGASCEVIGMSVPASEHSVMCMGTKDDEIGTFRRFIKELYPEGIVSIVSDTWDFWQVMTEYTVELKEEILSRNGKTVFRPDSGDPVKVLCGYDTNGVDYSGYQEATNAMILESSKGYDAVMVNGIYYPIKYEKSFGLIDMENPLSKAEIKGSVEVLWDIFGGTITEKGYKTLDSHVGMIYGDSITYQRCEEILSRLAEKGFSSDNVVFGIGSFTYQYVTRDTYGMAVKATFGIVDGEEREIFKDPKTGSGKKSAKGLLAVLEDKNGELFLRQEIPYSEYTKGVTGDKMQTVFNDGVHLIKPTLKEIRDRLGH